MWSEEATNHCFCNSLTSSATNNAASHTAPDILSPMPEPMTTFQSMSGEMELLIYRLPSQKCRAFQKVVRIFCGTISVTWVTQKSQSPAMRQSSKSKCAKTSSALKRFERIREMKASEDLAR